MSLKFVGLMRVKNEGRWIDESIEALLPLCSRVLVLDDHSTDNTAELCQREAVTLYKSPFSTLDESRDKTWLLRQAIDTECPDWVIIVDGDEILEKDGPDKIRQRIAADVNKRVLSVAVPYYWNDTDTVRIDGSFNKLVRGSVFKVSDLNSGEGIFSNGNYAKGGLHCGCIPNALLVYTEPTSDIALWHYGYIDAALRRRKHDWYNSVDGNNPNASYDHVIQGDVGGPEASASLRHAGPLVLSTVEEVCRQRGFSRRPKE